MHHNGFEVAVRQDSDMLDQTQTLSPIKQLKPIQTREMFMHESLEPNHVYPQVTMSLGR